MVFTQTLRYLLKRWYYLVIAGAVFALFEYVLKIRVTFLSVVSLIFLVRSADDLSDYDKDGGKRLSKEGLIFLCLLFAAGFVIWNLVINGYRGIFSLLLVLLVAVMNRAEQLKVLFLPAAVFYFLCMQGETGVKLLIYPAAGLVAAAAFNFYKKKRVK